MPRLKTIDERIKLKAIPVGTFNKRETNRFSNFEPELSKPGMILYTSGNTDKPRGVVLNFEDIDKRIKNLVSHFEINSNDNLLHFLSLDHEFSIDTMLSALCVGASVSFYPIFDTENI